MADEARMVGRQLNLLDPQDNAVAGVAIIRYLQKNADDIPAIGRTRPSR